MVERRDFRRGRRELARGAVSGAMGLAMTRYADIFTEAYGNIGAFGIKVNTFIDIASIVPDTRGVGLAAATAGAMRLYESGKWRNDPNNPEKIVFLADKRDANPHKRRKAITEFVLKGIPVAAAYRYGLNQSIELDTALAAATLGIGTTTRTLADRYHTQRAQNQTRWESLRSMIRSEKL